MAARRGEAAVDTASVPRYRVDLDAPPAQRWVDVIRPYKEHFAAIDTMIDAVLKEEVGSVLGPLLGSCAEGLLGAATRLGKVFYADELKAIAAESGMNLGKLVLMQLIYEATACCTSVVVPAGDGPVHIRTMDWQMDFLQPLTCEVDFCRGGQPVFSATTWAGYVGVLTGVRRGAASVSVNFRVTDRGTLWANLKQAWGDAWPTGFLLREVLTDATGFAEVAQWLSSSPLIAPCYFTVAGPGDSGARLLTRDRGACDRVWEMARDGPIVQPNMDWWDDDPGRSVMLSIQRRALARRRLPGVLGGGAGGAAPERPALRDALWKMMSEAPICNEITVYGTLMEPGTGLLETRLPRPRAGFCALPARQAARQGGHPLCRLCGRAVQPGVSDGVRGDCSHAGTWHGTYNDCSYLRCGFGLGPSDIGKQHWSCCFSTDPAPRPCSKSGAHVA